MLEEVDVLDDGVPYAVDGVDVLDELEEAEAAGVADDIALEGSVARDPTSSSTTGVFANGSFVFPAA